MLLHAIIFFFFSSRRRHTSSLRDWSSDVCSSDLHVRRRIRSPPLRCTASAVSLWLAETGPDDGWSRSGGDHARPVNHGPAIRRFHGGVAASRRFTAPGCGHNWGADYNMGHIHAVLSLDFPGRPLHRTTAW